MSEYRYLRNGEGLSIRAEDCSGCGACLEVCPHGVLALRGGVAEILDRELCMACGACARNCPAKAISAESGVGCAAAIIAGMRRGGEPSCGCGEGGACCG